MAIDAIFICALRSELEKDLVGSKIDKVQQPERDKIVLTLRTSSGNKKLLISAGTGSARIHFTNTAPENPADPPMFCMLMRKHLSGARIVSVEQPDSERMLVIRLSVFDEMGYAAEKKLIVELMGKNSNITLVGSDGRIIDCLRRRELDTVTMRCMQPGMIYRFPEKQHKINILCEYTDSCLVGHEFTGRDMDKYLMSVFTGISPLVCREIVHRCNDNIYALPAELARFNSFIEAAQFTPVMLCEGETPKDICFMNIEQYGNLYNSVVFDSFSQMLDAFYEKKDKTERQKSRSRDLTHFVKTIYNRISRKLDAQTAELEKSLDRESIRRDAELIKANLWQIKRGMTYVECDDYYADGCPKIRIKLDPMKTPQQNVTDLFKTYSKLKSAEAYLTDLLDKEEKELEYLASVIDEIERAESDNDLAEITAELIAQGYIKQQKNKKALKVKKQDVLHFVSSDGFEILVGKNNSQNDELTTKTARRTDMWLHVQKIHGSHVIVRAYDSEIPNSTLIEAAAIAAYYSQARDAGKVPVDYTMVRYVKKPSGSAPGKVVYTDYKTIIAKPDEKIIDLLKSK